MGKTHTESVKKLLSELAREPEAAARWKQFRALGPAAYARRVMCSNDGRIFESATAAAAHYGVAKSALIELCLGQKQRRTVGGMHFKYIGAE